MGLKNKLLSVGLMLVLCLSGCGVESDKVEGPKTNEDTFGCIASTSFENARSGRTINGLGVDYAARYAYEYVEETGRDELHIYTLLNDETEVSFAVEEEEGTHVVFAGSAYDKSQTVLIVRREADVQDEIEAEFRNRDGSVYKTVVLNGIEAYKFEHNTVEVMSDSAEYIYISYAVKNGDSHCLVFAPDGNLYKEISLGTYICTGLCAMPDGSVAFEKQKLSSDDGETCYDSFDVKSGEVKPLFSYRDSRSFDEGGIICANVYDDEHVVYADKDGVYLSDYSMENSTKIFTWKQNGIEIQQSPLAKARICASDKGEINIVTESRGIETLFVLKEMPENVVKIELAANNVSLDYERAVNEFNKKNPDCRIVINDEYDKNILYTKIISGDGPVLLDSNMIPFREQKKAWEPLSNLVNHDILEDLSEVAVNLGTINGTLYGAAEGFQIRSLVSCFDRKNWTYDQYLNLVEESTSEVWMLSPVSQESKTALIYQLFCYDLYDSFFIDSENPEKPVDRQKLERVLDDVEKYYDEKSDGSDCLECVFNRRSAAMPAYFASPAEIREVSLFIDKGAEAVGYPGKNGSKSYAFSGSMLVVRANASEEEKAVASRFLNYLLSYEWQHEAVKKGVMTSFASRRDVLEEQIEAAFDNGEHTLFYGSERYDLGDVDAQKLRTYLQDLFDTISFETDINEDYRDIVCEELGSYYNDGIGIDALEDRLNKRIGLLLKEKR